jgi:hypothetical protein
MWYCGGDFFHRTSCVTGTSPWILVRHQSVDVCRRAHGCVASSLACTIAVLATKSIITGFDSCMELSRATTDWWIGDSRLLKPQIISGKFWAILHSYKCENETYMWWRQTHTRTPTAIVSCPATLHNEFLKKIAGKLKHLDTFFSPTSFFR